MQEVRHCVGGWGCGVLHADSDDRDRDRCSETWDSAGIDAEILSVVLGALGAAT